MVEMRPIRPRFYRDHEQGRPRGRAWAFPRKRQRAGAPAIQEMPDMCGQHVPGVRASSAQSGGYVRACTMDPLSYRRIALAATGQIRLSVVIGARLAESGGFLGARAVPVSASRRRRAVHVALVAESRRFYLAEFPHATTVRRPPSSARPATARVATSDLVGALPQPPAAVTGSPPTATRQRVGTILADSYADTFSGALPFAWAWSASRALRCADAMPSSRSPATTRLR